MTIEKTLERYREIDRRVKEKKENVQTLEVEIKYDLKSLREKSDLLKEKGIEFENISELEDQLGDLEKELSEILDATERKLDEADRL